MLLISIVLTRVPLNFEGGGGVDLPTYVQLWYCVLRKFYCIQFEYRNCTVMKDKRMANLNLATGVMDIPDIRIAVSSFSKGKRKQCRTRKGGLKLGRSDQTRPVATRFWCLKALTVDALGLGLPQAPLVSPASPSSSSSSCSSSPPAPPPPPHNHIPKDIGARNAHTQRLSLARAEGAE